MCMKGIMTISKEDQDQDYNIMKYIFRNKHYRKSLQEITNIFDNINYTISIIGGGNIGWSTPTVMYVTGLGNMLKKINKIYSEYNENHIRFMLYFNPSLKTEEQTSKTKFDITPLNEYKEVQSQLFSEEDYERCISFIIRTTVTCVSPAFNYKYKLSISNDSQHLHEPLFKSFKYNIFNFSLLFNDNNGKITNAYIGIPLYLGITNRNIEDKEIEVTYNITKNSNVFQPIGSDGKFLDELFSTILVVYEYLSNSLFSISEYINLYIHDDSDMEVDTFYINGNKIKNFDKLDILRDLLISNGFIVRNGNLRVSLSDKDLLNSSMDEVDIFKISKEVAELIHSNIDLDTAVIVPYWLAHMLLIGKSLFNSFSDAQKLRTAIIPLAMQYDHRYEKDEHENTVYRRDVHIKKYTTIKV